MRKLMLAACLAAIAGPVMSAPITYLNTDNINQTSVSVANPLPVTVAPSSSAALAPAALAAAAACQVLKASAGTLFSTSGYASAASWIMVFNAASAPVDGAVTPTAVAYVSAAGSWSISYVTPATMSTGITVCASSTGPYTKTAFATSNFITGQVQ